MKREDLKDLELSDKQIEAVIKISGKDIEDFKKSNDSYKSQITDLTSERDSYKTQFDQTKTQLDAAAKNKGNSEELQKQLTDLQGQMKKSQQEAADQLKQAKINGAIELGLTKASAINPKAVTPFLNTEAISLSDKGEVIGLNDQIKTLQAGDDTSFLFKKDDGQIHSAVHNEHNLVHTGNSDEASKADILKAFDLSEK